MSISMFSILSTGPTEPAGSSRGIFLKTQAECDLTKPEEMFAWCFAAGVPDPRGEKYGYVPMISANCFGVLSKMLYDMGARFHPDEQKLWVQPGFGPAQNFAAWGATDVLPNAAAMLVEEFPDKAAELAKVTPETHRAALEDAAKKMVDSIQRLQAAKAAAEAAAAGGVDGGAS